MHYTGTIWRPPYEADSLLLEVTAGCTHHRCKFCTLYEALPFPFRMSPMEDIEADLLEAQTELRSWRNRIESRLMGRPVPKVRRVFLTGANPLVLPAKRLLEIGERIHQYFPECETIGCFARVTDIARKTDEELRLLREMGYTGISIGVETGDEKALTFMDKGYPAEEIVTQMQRLDAADIAYCLMYLAGIHGAGRGREGAAASAQIFNRTHPKLIGASMMTVYPGSRLYEEIRQGNWTEETELEKLEELEVLIQDLEIPTYFATLGASNAVFVEGNLPEDRERMLAVLRNVCRPENEAVLRQYRVELPHL